MRCGLSYVEVERFVVVQPVVQEQLWAKGDSTALGASIWLHMPHLLQAAACIFCATYGFAARNLESDAFRAQNSGFPHAMPFLNAGDSYSDQLMLRSASSGLMAEAVILPGTVCIGIPIDKFQEITPGGFNTVHVIELRSLV